MSPLEKLLLDELEDAARKGLDFARALLKTKGVVVTDDLVNGAIAIVVALFKSGPGVTHATRLEVDDQR